MRVDWEARQKIQPCSQVQSRIYEISSSIVSLLGFGVMIKKRHRTVLEVELVSFQDRKSWFVFEVELDGETEISQWYESKSLSIHCQLDRDSWEMAKVAHAANQIVKLPAVPTREYSNLFCVFNKVSEKNCCMGLNWLPAPATRTKGPSFLEGPAKHLTFDFRKQSRTNHRNNIVLLARNHSDAAQGVQEEQTRKHSPQSGPGGEVSFLLSSVMSYGLIWIIEIMKHRGVVKNYF